MFVKNISIAGNPDRLIDRLEKIYNRLSFAPCDFREEKESQDYAACRFRLNGSRIVFREAKITPKKSGQFVTLWKRIGDGPIQPFSSMDNIDLFVINTCSKTNFGQFVFPKQVLINKGIVSSASREGKRGIRIYPPWDEPASKQAKKTQSWQMEHFLSLSNVTKIDLKRVNELYKVIPHK
ncbi:MAG: MepB family protein [Calditrichia bacterium]